MSNRFTKYTADKLRTEGWMDKEQADALRTRLQQVESERDRLKESVLEFENREASVCPENTPFEQVIKSLLERLKEAEWLLVNCPNSCDPEPAVFKEWWNRRDAFLNPKPQHKG